MFHYQFRGLFLVYFRACTVIPDLLHILGVNRQAEVYRIFIISINNLGGEAFVVVCGT
jgi:hypothetical protein